MMSVHLSSRTFVGLAVVLLLGASVVVGGCDVTFDPFVDNERDYSIGGYLDVRADTQFVRVERLRDSLLYDTKLLSATVTLEHLETGQTWTWRDSLFQLGPGRRVHNFWSTASIVPRATYRFSVQGPDGRSSAATVTLPDTFPDPHVRSYPECLGRSFRCSGDIYVRITGIDQFAAVRAVYRYNLESSSSQGCEETTTVNELQNLQSTEEGFLVRLDWKAELRQFDEVSAFTDVDLHVAAGGPGWPDAATLADVGEENLFLPGNWSNVDGGVGFLGGVASKVVDVYPPRDCKGDTGESSEHE